MKRAGVRLARWMEKGAKEACGRRYFIGSNPPWGGFAQRQPGARQPARLRFAEASRAGVTFIILQIDRICIAEHLMLGDAREAFTLFVIKTLRRPPRLVRRKLRHHTSQGLGTQRCRPSCRSYSAPLKNPGGGNRRGLTDSCIQRLL
jgi:hypothetical protein